MSSTRNRWRDSPRDIIHYEPGCRPEWHRFLMSPPKVLHLLQCIEPGLTQQLAEYTNDVAMHGETSWCILVDQSSQNGYRSMVNTIWGHFAPDIFMDGEGLFLACERFVMDLDATLRYMREYAAAHGLCTGNPPLVSDRWWASSNVDWRDYALPSDVDINRVCICIRQALDKIPPPHPYCPPQKKEERHIPYKRDIAEVLHSCAVLLDFASRLCDFLQKREARERQAFAASLLARAREGHPPSTFQRAGVPLEVAERIATHVPVSHLQPVARAPK